MIRLPSLYGWLMNGHVQHWVTINLKTRTKYVQSRKIEMSNLLFWQVKGNMSLNTWLL